jgi:hypothetical protein
MSLITRVHDLSGSLILDLNASNGYSRDKDGFSLPGVAWRRTVVTSPVVDGEFESQRTKGAGKANLILRVKGSTWLEVEQRVNALEEAVSEPFLLVAGLGATLYTFRARPADVDASFTIADIVNLSRIVSLEIPVQPNPTIEGL